MSTIGLIFALITLLCWAFGDFFIQRTAKKIGDIRALFFITAFGGIVLLPFVWNHLPALFTNSSHLELLGISTVIIFFGALFNFEALKEGKLAIVEPVIALELPITVGLSIALHAERITFLQFVAMMIIFAGIMLTITKKRIQLKSHRDFFERGILMAGLGAIGMALTNFLVGVSSQSISPLVTIWFMHSGIAILCLAWMLVTKTTHLLAHDLQRSPGMILAECVFDNGAWVSYAFTTTYLPISIAVTMTESSIALAVLLGVILNRERIKKHQYLGIALSLVGLLVLSFFAP